MAFLLKRLANHLRIVDLMSLFLCKHYWHIGLATQREQAKRDIECASDLWGKWSIDERRSFLRMVTDSITLEEIATGWLRVTIVWSSLMGYVSGLASIGYVWRQSGSQWSEGEDSIIKELYPNATRLEMLQALPTRSYVSISTRAKRLHVKRYNLKKEVRTIPDDTSLQDAKIISEFMLKPVERVQWHTERLTNHVILS
jgi:hypothetical protein